MTILLLLTALAQVPDIPYSGFFEDTARLLRFTAALDGLEEDPSLLERHRGLSAFLEGQSSIASAENAYREHLRLPTFRRLAGAFEEALHEDAIAHERIDEYYSAFARDQALDSKIDALLRIELREGRRDSAFAAAVAYLKSHPEEAATFLDNPQRLIPTPDALYPLRNRFRNDRELHADLSHAFEELDRDAAVHQYVLPWWKIAFSPEGEFGAAYLALESHLRRTPQRYWVWHRRNAAWAAEARAREWLRHFYGQIRRNDALRDTYFEFSALLRERPALGDAMESAWEEKFGPKPAWPPEGWPPELPPRADSDEWSVESPEPPLRPSREAITPQRPRVPRREIDVPSRPVRPTPSKPYAPRPGSDTVPE